MAQNWWMIGYRAAMKAKSNTKADLDAAMFECKATTPFERDLFEAGWKSVWKCERAGEDDGK